MNCIKNSTYVLMASPDENQHSLIIYLKSKREVSEVHMLNSEDFNILAKVSLPKTDMIPFIQTLEERLPNHCTSYKCITAITEERE